MIDAAIVGMGRWGRVLVESVQGKSEAIRFVAGCTRSADKAADWARTQGIRMLPDYDAVLADPAVGAVVLATPHSQHAGQVIAAARAGKQIFVEKPFTLTRASAEQAVAAVRQAGVVMALGHNRRFLPAVARLKRMIAEGALGTLCHIEGNISGPGALAYKPGMWRADPVESPAGGLAGMGIHMLDMFQNLCGPLAEVSVVSHARVATNGLDDTTAALVRFGSGVTGTLTTLAAVPRLWRLQVFGSEAWVEMWGTDTLVVGCEGKPHERIRFEPTDLERAELEAFAAACAGGPAYPLSLEEAVHSAAMFEAVARGARSPGWIAVP
ncbi:Gfo/Idh/MocA family oxidoreductase [Elioraea sp.]|uniref:Gfo/Idh/MocA family protein n=1 Tax=Elioraea sp. TaxID=2185103 RepID=UPI00307DA2F2